MEEKSVTIEDVNEESEKEEGELSPEVKETPEEVS